MTEDTNVAIACQGGGSHTAFTAGVLKRLLRGWDDDHELVGISGTSGGAFNALAAWYGLVTEGEQRAITLLDSIWEDLAARSLSDRMINDWVDTVNRMQSSGMPVPQYSPYQMPGPELGKERIRTVLETHIDFEELPTYCRATAPELVVGTVNINAGVFETFTNEDVSVEAVLASAAVPNMFEAVEINGHYHWDGLFSQNPPVRDLMHQPVERKPDELWIIQINPVTDNVAIVTGAASGIGQATAVALATNGLTVIGADIDTDGLDETADIVDEFSKTTVHRIEMDDGYHCSTKLDREPEFIQELMDLGNSHAKAFLEDRSS